MATIFITHDLALAAEYCDRIVVMHAGHIVEIGAGPALFAAPRHPYSAKLLAATPGETATLDEPGVDPGQPARSAPRRPAVLPLQRALRAAHRRRATGPLPRRALGERHLVACWNPL